ILLEMLRPFAERGVNLSSLMSRPLRSGLGLYCFILVVDAHSSTPELGAALSELLDHGVRIKNLGSYLAWRSAAPAAGAHAEYPRGSVAASDDPDRQRRVLLPPTDPAQ
ncbi:MAG TPA: prephenate dehydratase, partial [Acidimicrobiia bacterium]